MISRSMWLVLAVAVLVTLGACGETPGERGLTGAGIGAAGGAVIGAVTPIGPGAGALIGGAVGGVAGATTTPSQINLGKPAWRSGSSSGGAGTAYADPTVRDIQAGLQRLGYSPGPVDGRFGPRTDAAIRRYQQDHGLPVDGQPTAGLLDDIRARSPG